MSKLYKRYLQLKATDSSKIYLFKSGIFYIFLDHDAKIMSNILNLKLTNLNDEIVKCGFPVNTLNKYLNTIIPFGYNISIIDSIKEEPISSKNYFLNSNVKNLIHLLSSIDSNHLSISEAYSLIDNLCLQAKKIEKEMIN